jgi:hypothetical protein
MVTCLPTPTSPPALPPIDAALAAMLPKAFLGCPTFRTSVQVGTLAYGLDGCLFVCETELAAYARSLRIDQDKMTGAYALPRGTSVLLAIAIRSPGVATDRLIKAYVEAHGRDPAISMWPVTVGGKDVTYAYLGPCMVRGIQYLYAFDDVLFVVLDATNGMDERDCEEPNAAITDAISQLP